MRVSIFLSLCVALNIKSHHCLPAREVTRTCDACLQHGNDKLGLSFADSESRVEESRWGPEAQLFDDWSFRGPNAKVVGDFDARKSKYGVSLAHLQVGDHKTGVDLELVTVAVELGHGFMARLGAVTQTGQNNDGDRANWGINLDTGFMNDPNDVEAKFLGIGFKVGKSGMEFCVFVCFGFR